MVLSTLRANSSASAPNFTASTSHYDDERVAANRLWLNAFGRESRATTANTTSEC
jgi:hypothetical protein